MKKTVILAASLILIATGCGNQQPTPQSSASKLSSATSSSTGTIESATNSQASGEKPLAPEKNPVGDIPDSQVFVTYSSKQGGYSFKAPEGWARSEQGTGVAFVDKYDGVKVTIEQASQAPTAVSIKANQAAALVKNGHAVKIVNVQTVNLPGGDAVLVKFESNSDPNAVTGKQVRQENECYYFYKNGKLAALTLWAPQGADNVDQWKMMSESFRWN